MSAKLEKVVIVRDLFYVEDFFPDSENGPLDI
jgi:hypothetical protein